MILCLVTDRRQLGRALGLPSGDLIAALTTQVIAAARAGVDFVQVREPDLEPCQLVPLIRALVEACQDYPTRILVNDRLDVAIAAGAAGVHLKESSFAPELVRRLAPKSFVISAAVHTPFTAAARRFADLLVAGTVLPTGAKPAADYLGKSGLRTIVAAARSTPVIGIGGLDPTSIAPMAETGIAGVAAVGAFIPAAATQELTEFVRQRVAAMRFAFDSTTRDPGKYELPS